MVHIINDPYYITFPLTEPFPRLLLDPFGNGIVHALIDTVKCCECTKGRVGQKLYPIGHDDNEKLYCFGHHPNQEKAMQLAKKEAEESVRIYGGVPTVVI